MGWFEDSIQYFKDAWKYNLPVLSPAAGIPALSPKELLTGAVAVPLGALGGGAAALAAGKIPAVARWMGPATGVANATYSTPTDRPRPSMLDTRVPGTGRYDPYTGRRGPGKTVGQLARETALKEGLREVRARVKRRKAPRRKASRSSRPRATSRRSAADYEPAPKARRARRRSTRPPSAAQLRARRNFAKMARERAAARRR